MLRTIPEIVRCPYCVIGDDFRPLLSRSSGTLVCTKCGHSVVPNTPSFRCSCPHCEMVDRAA